MSEAERGVMLAHQDYWLPQINAGLVIAMGPVADPKGAYGVMIVNAPSLKMLEDWQSQDPAILSAHGFAFETYQMPALRVAPTEPLAPVNSISP
ncbi:MAG: hypothetical protein KGM15_15480, partial [Pseudomonadota bacterium]|nr:hypothetical protein [Pseudomonadota bacterium]